LVAPLRDEFRVEEAVMMNPPVKKELHRKHRYQRRRSSSDAARNLFAVIFEAAV
jgi:hypothetical protein